MKRFINFIKGIFCKEKGKRVEGNKKNTLAEAMFIYANDGVDLCHKASRMCVGRDSLPTQKEKEDHLSKLVSLGHESILEHSNIVMTVYMSNTKDNMDELLAIAPHFHFLNFKTKVLDDIVYVLLSGSTRAYKHIYRNIDNLNNAVLRAITRELYKGSYSALFMDLINDGILEDSFVYQKYSGIDLEETIIDGIEQVEAVPIIEEKEYPKSDRFEIINVDDVNNIMDDVVYIFSDDDMLDVCTATIVFKGVSRAIANQLVRHRVAITQESQRYVDYSTAKFIDPTQFKDSYDKAKLYSVVDFNGNRAYLSAQDLGNYLMTMYTATKSEGLAKEDARAYLPLNCETKLVMTFTLRQLFKFLELRTHKAAQAEVRTLAIELQEAFTKVLKGTNLMQSTIDNALKPKYKLELEELEEINSNLDEIISEEIID